MIEMNNYGKMKVRWIVRNYVFSRTLQQYKTQDKQTNQSEWPQLVHLNVQCSLA